MAGEGRRMREYDQALNVYNLALTVLFVTLTVYNLTLTVLFVTLTVLFVTWIVFHRVAGEGGRRRKHFCIWLLLLSLWRGPSGARAAHDHVHGSRVVY